MKALTHERPHLLIDGDIYAFRAALSAEKSITFDNVNYHKTADLEQAKRRFSDTISSFKREFRTSDITIAFSDTTNFRKKILPTYKFNRQDKARPLVLEELKSAMQLEYPCMRRDNLEADDVLGILVTSKTIIANPNKIIVSIDKDMNTLPCRWFNSDLDKLRTCDYVCANFRHMVQTLSGDACDGYKGCPSVGEKRAGQLLVEHRENYAAMWKVVVNAFKKAGLTEQDALVQSRCARVLRNYDYDYKNKAPILWSVLSERRYRA